MAKFEQLSKAIRSGRYKTAGGARRALAYAKGITKAQRRTLNELINSLTSSAEQPDHDPPPAESPDRGSASGEIRITKVAELMHLRKMLTTYRYQLSIALLDMTPAELREYADRVEQEGV